MRLERLQISILIYHFSPHKTGWGNIIIRGMKTKQNQKTHTQKKQGLVGIRQRQRQVTSWL